MSFLFLGCEELYQFLKLGERHMLIRCEGQYIGDGSDGGELSSPQVSI